jgi:two-component system response regulator YesN
VYSLMIVDDEPIVLKAISHVVETSCPRIKVVAQTGSGLEAVSLARLEKPDIILIDIELTGLNGLDAAAEIQKTLPETVIVIISAYDNFQYAKKGIALGVMDYLLKPVSKDDLVGVLAKAGARLEEQRGKSREQLELKDKLSKIRPFLEEDLFFSLLYPGIGMHPLQDYPQLLELDFRFGQAIEVYVPDSDRLTANFDRYKQLIKNQLFEAKIILFGPVFGRTSLLLIAYDSLPGVPKSRWEEARRLLQSNSELDATIILGPILPEFDGMIRSFRELRQSVWQYAYRPGVFLLEELAAPPEPGIEIPCRVEQEFFEAVKLGQAELARLVFQDLQRLITAAAGTDLKSLQDYFRGIIAVLRRIFYENAPESSGRLWDGGEAVAKINRIFEPGEVVFIFDEIITELTRYIDNGAFPEKNPEIRAAVEFMEQHFHRDLTLADIATAVAISPGYLTKLFKERRNQTVMDCLERIRIGEALKLLKETNQSIKEIAIKVGYHDPNYFSKVFKKVTHASPTEIRR